MEVSATLARFARRTFRLICEKPGQSKPSPGKDRPPAADECPAEHSFAGHISISSRSSHGIGRVSRSRKIGKFPDTALRPSKFGRRGQCLEMPPGFNLPSALDRRGCVRPQRRLIDLFPPRTFWNPFLRPEPAGGPGRSPPRTSSAPMYILDTNAHLSSSP